MISPNPSLYNRELSVPPQVSLSGKHLIPAMEVLSSADAAGGRVLCSERQNCLSGLGKVWEPVPVGWNRREVAFENVIQTENVLPVEARMVTPEIKTGLGLTSSDPDGYCLRIMSPSRFRLL